MAKIRIDGVIGWDVLAADIVEALASDTDHEIIINSGGGSIIEGFSIYNAIKSHQGKIDVQIDFAGSMASVIAMAGDTITMFDKSSLMMIHRPWSGAMGRSDDLRKEADTLDKLEVMLGEIYLEQSDGKVSADKLSDLLDAETWLDAKEAKTLGLITTVASGESTVNNMAMAAMGFDVSKLAAKVNKMQSLKPKLDTAESLADIESALSDSGRISKADVTALVSRIKASVTHSDCDDAKLASVLTQINLNSSLI